MEDKLLTSARFAHRLGIKEQTARAWRHRGHGPKYLRWSPRGPVFYLVEDVEAWLQTHRFSSTSDETVRNQVPDGSRADGRRRKGRDSKSGSESEANGEA